MNKKNNVKKRDFSKIRMWLLLWSLGLIGQIGWSVEGTWFNTFVYEKIEKNPSIITPMLILSALATTVSIFLFGVLSDRTGKRRTLISYGYIIWGILTVCFGLTQFIADSYRIFAIICIIFGDMLVSFFASMSTDVGFSTWTTDIMNDKNRGQIGAAIAVQCVLGTLLGNIIGGFLVGTENNYLRMFIVIGSVLAFFGIVSIFLMNKKDDVAPSARGSFSNQFLSVFNFKNLFKQKELVLISLSVAIFFIGFDTYFPHLGNYIIHYLGFSADKMGIIEAVPLVLAMVVTIPASGLINKNKFFEVSLFAIVSGVLGLFFIFPISQNSIDTSRFFDLRLFLGIFFLGISYVVMLQTAKVWTKNLFPKDSKGQYEGIWAISYALIPMFFGSTISERIVKTSGVSIFNEAIGRLEYIPNGNIFLVGVIISTLSIIPIIIAKKYRNK